MSFEDNGGFEEYQAGDDFSSGGKFLNDSNPGCYHMQITGVRRPAAKANGDLINNGWAVICCAVLAPQAAEGKTFDITLWNPKLDAKDGGAFGRKKNDRFLIAAGLIPKNSEGKKVGINWGSAVGRQFLVKLTVGEPDAKGRRYLDVDFANFYHVDDPEAGTDYPRNASAIAMIPSQLRLTAATDQKPAKPVRAMDI